MDRAVHLFAIPDVVRVIQDVDHARQDADRVSHVIRACMDAVRVDIVHSIVHHADSGDTVEVLATASVAAAKKL